MSDSSLPLSKSPLSSLFFSSLQLTPRSNFPKFPFNFRFDFNLHASKFVTELLKVKPFLDNVTKIPLLLSAAKKPPLFCSTSLALAELDPVLMKSQLKTDDEPGAVGQSKNLSGSRAVAEEERVLISEVLVRNKDGEEMERKDLEAEALNALKASRANSALTVREVQDDVHRIIGSGYFTSCLPVAVDTRDGIRLIFQVFYVLDMLVCSCVCILMQSYDFNTVIAVCTIILCAL